MKSLLDRLPESLFYYCAGKDPTPILIFGARVPLYVYADHLRYSHGTPEEVLSILAHRLEKGGYTRIGGRPVDTELAAELSVWQDGEGARFSLLYLVADASDAYFSLYGGSTLPRYICNYRYEMNNARLAPFEEKVEYILGHCHSPAHSAVADYPYRGDYSFGRDTRITLYRRCDPDGIL